MRWDATGSTLARPYPVPSTAPSTWYKKFGGWDEAGLKRYSAIAGIVNAQRILLDRQEYEKEYRQHHYNKMYENDINKKKEENDAFMQEKVYTAYNDLGDDEASASEAIDVKSVKNEDISV